MSCRIADIAPLVERKGERAVARLEDDAPCTGCNAAGYKPVQQDGGMVLAPCEGFYARRRVQLFNRAGLPARFATAGFQSFSVGSNKDLMEAHGSTYQWAKSYRLGNPEQRPGIVLAGPPGVGKTHLAAAVVRWLTLDTGVPCRFVDYVELVQSIKAGWDQGHGSADLLEELATVEVLVIDDLGQGMPTEWNRTLVDTLVSRRYNGGLATIATTNFAVAVSPEEKRRVFGAQGVKVEDLADRVGGRVASRLIGGALVVSMTGRDFRRGPG